MVARRPFFVQIALTFAVLFSAVGVALSSGSGSGPVALAAGQVISLVQHTSDNLASYPSIAMTLSVDANSNGQQQRVTATGYFVPDGSQGQFQLNIPGVGATEERLVNGMVYVNIAKFRGLPAGKQWIGTRYQGASSVTDSSSTMSALTMLAGANGPVARVGTQSIDGVNTTHYRLHVDLNAAATRAPARWQSAIRQLSTLLVAPPTVEVWLDSHGAPRQFRMTYVLRNGSFAMTMKLHGSQKVLHVQAPPASQVQISDTANPIGG